MASCRGVILLDHFADTCLSFAGYLLGTVVAFIFFAPIELKIITSNICFAVLECFCLTRRLRSKRAVTPVYCWTDAPVHMLRAVYSCNRRNCACPARLYFKCQNQATHFATADRRQCHSCGRITDDCIFYGSIDELITK